MYSQCAVSKFITMWLPRPPPPSHRVTLNGRAIVGHVILLLFFLFSIRIELTLNETSGKLIKMQSFAHENHKNSFDLIFLFRFHLMLFIVLLSVSKRGAVSSYFPLETGANCQTGVLKRLKKYFFWRFIGSISEKLTSLVHFEMSALAWLISKQTFTLTDC